MVSVDRPDAVALDRADPLAPYRERFVVDDPDLAYLDGNSLGRLPRATIERVERTLRDEWGGQLVRAWDHWIDLPRRIGDRIAAAFLGARPGEVVVADSTTVNLYRLAAAALAARPGRPAIVTDRGNFPTDRYVFEGLAEGRGGELRWIDGDPVEGVEPAAVAAALDAEVALVGLCLVDYRSAAVADVATITAAAHDAGALVLWDLSHAVGAIPIDLEAAGVDLAVGCTYKYLNGGPGSPSFLYVRSTVQDVLRPPIQGWFAQRDQFAMGPRFDRAPGIAGWQVGTPPILALAAVEAGVEATAEPGIAAIRDKSVALTSFAIERFEADLAPLGFELGSPRHADRRGSHVAVRHADGRRLVAELAADGIVTDFREPDVIRLGLSPLTTRFRDVNRAISSLRTRAARPRT